MRSQLVWAAELCRHHTEQPVELYTVIMLNKAHLFATKFWVNLNQLAIQTLDIFKSLVVSATGASAKTSCKRKVDRLGGGPMAFSGSSQTPDAHNCSLLIHTNWGHCRFGGCSHGCALPTYVGSASC